MKKLALLSAVLFGTVVASQAGVHLNIGIGIPFPRSERVIVTHPAPVFVERAPVCPPTRVYVAPRYYAPPPRVIYAPPVHHHVHPPHHSTHYGRSHHRDYGRHGGHRH